MVLVAQNFKEWLLEQLKKNDWTYEGLGDLIGVSHGAVGGWVRGKFLPDPSSLRQLAKVTHVDDVWLFRMIGYLAPSENEPERDPEIDGLIDRIMQLPPGERAELEAIVELKLKRLGRG